MTFWELQAAVLADLNQNSVPSASTLTRIKRYLNEGLRAVLREPGLEQLVDSDTPYRFTSVSGQARYAVPEAAARLKRMSDRTSDWTLEALPLDRYRRLDPDAASTSGTPTHYVPIGRVAVAAQPTVSGLVAKSTFAGDTTQTVYLEALLDEGSRRLGAALLTGTTAVAVTGALEVEDFYLSAPCTGTVTLHEVSGAGALLAQITPGRLRPRYLGFYLWPTPASPVTYYVDYRREVLDLVADTDEPPLPTDFHPLLTAYARMREYEKGDDDRYALAAREYQQALNRLKFATQWASDELPVLGRAGRVGHSRLGSHYPADSWR